MTTITIDRATVEQALEALTPWMDSDHTVQHAAYHALRAALAQQAEPVLQTCNCRWDGEVQVQQCTLHEAHVDAIHEWAERAKVAERKLAQQAEPGEPVAYIHRQGNYWDTSERHLTDDEKARGWTEEPLYTAPPQRKPLTEKEIDALPWNGSPRQFARAVERAHNITDPQVADRLARHGIPMPGDPK